METETEVAARRWDDFTENWCAVNAALVDCGELRSDFAYLVARPR